MNEVRRAIKSAAWRLVVTDFLRALAICLTIAVCAVFLARLVEMLFGLTFPWRQPMGGVFAGVGAATLLSAIVWTFVVRRRELAVARELDERAGLRESLSTALCVEKSPDPWARNVVEAARAKAVSVKVGEAIPIAAPRAWPAPLLASLALVLLWFTLAPIDLLGILAKKEEKEKARQNLMEVKSDIQQKEQKLKEILAKTEVKFDQDKTSDPSLNKPEDMQKPEELQRAAVKKLTDLNESLNQLKQGEKAEQLQALKDKMEQLKQPGPGPLSELQRAMARGEFGKAQEALEELKKAMQDGSMSEEQKEQAKKQLENLGDQLKKAAEDQKQVQQKLEQAGLTQEQAKQLMQQMKSDPQAAQQALEQMKNMSPEQKEQLMKMAMAQMKASQQCQNMGESMSQMSQNMGKQGMNQEGQQAAESLGEQLGAGEMMDQDMQSLDSAMKECQSQLAQLGECMGGNCQGGDKDGMNRWGKTGQWKAGDKHNLGQGTGGPGRGMGSNKEDSPTDYTSQKDKANVQNNGGPIIGSRLVQGEQIKGESVAEFSEAVTAAEKNATEALTNEQVPSDLHPAVKKYFGRLGDKVKPKITPGDAPSSKPAEKPANDAKDAKK